MLRPDEEALLDSLEGAVIAADAEGHIAYANAAAGAVFRWERPPIGQALTVLMPERMRERHGAGFRRYRESGESKLEGRQVRVPALRADGREIEIELAIRHFQRPDGSRLLLASVAETTNLPAASRHVLELETRLTRRAYQLI